MRGRVRARGHRGRPRRQAAATARACRWTAAKVYPVAGRVAPPAVPIRNTEAPARRGKRASVIGITPCSTATTSHRAGPSSCRA
ncbi:hypothetical protein SPAR_26401 [Streptomyces sparsogenes DSM 40356]|uniref:Uncharacterized protein n=1 Tax=Streptomyces sparsogenes DSM 40356 TaxID=1331668 RepID=A0A1R1SDQ3_9ACTN|nr:hypothetical protein SPAR_26401 [Streptomyces sparsogenes DSM 40356]